MADDNEIRISITLDDGSVKEGFARIKKDGEDSASGLGDAFSSAKNQLLALAGAYLSFSAAKKLIETTTEAAAQYETSLNNMNKALASAGSYTAEASAGFQELAKSMAATTTYSQTQVLGLEALARNYTATNAQAKELTKAAVDLAAATGKDASTAIQQLGGTLDGTAGRLAKLVPALRSLTEYQLRTGDAIAIVGQRFKDAASGDVDTYAGTLKRLGNSFEELQIAIGELITQSPTVRAVLQFITAQLGQMADAIKGLGGNDSFIKQWTLDVLNFGREFNTYVIYPIELIGNVAKIAVNEIKDFVQDLLATFADAASKIVGFFSPKSELASTLKNFAESSREVLTQFDNDLKQSMKDIGDSKFSDGIELEINKLTEVVNNAKPFATMRQDMQDVQDDLLRMSGGIDSVAGSFALMQKGASSSFALLAADANKYMTQIGASVSKVLVGGVSNAFVQLGRALVTGKNLFAAFAGAMLSALGEAAVQMGAMYILMGIARAFSTYGLDPTAEGMIATGAAMSVLGGALMALGEGASGGAPNTSVPSGGGPSIDTGGGGAPVSGNPADNVGQKQAQIQVNIQGSVFDTHETGLRIVELVNDAFNTQGAQVQVK